MAYARSHISQPITSDPIVDDYLDTLNGDRRYRSSGADRGDLLALMKHQLQLEWSIKTIKSFIDSDTAEKAQRALEAAEDTTATLRSFITGSLGCDPVTFAPSKESARKAQQVFDVPELAEAILGELSAKDLLAALQVNHAMSSTVVSSPKLQVILGLRPWHDCYWWSNFECSTNYSKSLYGGFMCNVSFSDRRTADPGMPLDKARVTAQCGAQGWQSQRWQPPRLGSRVRRMLICQPPIYEMTVEPSCCGNHRDPYGLELPPPPPFSVLRSKSGLTVGDIIDATVAARHEHRHCSYASQRDHDPKTGLVNMQVYFTGYLALHPGDPALPIYYNPQDFRSPDYYGEHLEAEEQRMKQPDPLRDYIEAKHFAVTNGEPVPTFEEFRAASGLREEDGVGGRPGDEGSGLTEEQKQNVGKWV